MLNAPVFADGLDDIAQEFLVESYENLDELDRALVALEKEPGSRPLLASIFRTIHTIKGTSGFLAFNRLEAVTHVGENVLSKLRDGKLELTPEITTVLLRMVDTVRELLAGIERTGAEEELDTSDVERALAACLDPEPTAAAVTVETTQTTDTVSTVETEHTPAGTRTHEVTQSTVVVETVEATNVVGAEHDVHVVERHETVHTVDATVPDAPSAPRHEEPVAEIAPVAETAPIVPTAVVAPEAPAVVDAPVVASVEPVATVEPLQELPVTPVATESVATVLEPEHLNARPSANGHTNGQSSGHAKGQANGPAHGQTNGHTNGQSAHVDEHADEHADEDPQRRSVADSSIRVDVGVLDQLMRMVGELVLTRNQVVRDGVDPGLAHRDAGPGDPEDVEETHQAPRRTSRMLANRPSTARSARL
jgi:two-component system chemotaxis sensor kinase CheA